MSDESVQANEQNSEKSASPASGSRFRQLRIWPPVVLVLIMSILVVTGRLLPFLFNDELLLLLLVAMMGPAALGLLILIWWLAFSRSTLLERLIGFFGALLVGFLAVVLSDKTMHGPAVMLMTIPMGTIGFALGAIVCHRVLSFQRTWVAILLATCGFGFTTLLRSDGMWAHGVVDWHWRWVASAEDKMMAARESMPKHSLAGDAASDLDSWLAKPEWPRFRGSDGRGQNRGPRIEVNWDKHPPKEVWRRQVGPGWSSFAVAGNLLFTQEQHQDQEAVVCYAADSGNEIWVQSIESRFFDALGGPGPRATPTISNGMLFAQGANGQLQRLDPKSGALIWKKDLQKIANRKPPQWGFSSSPLVVGTVVIVHAGGAGDKGTLAFDVDSGDLKWSVPAGDHTYSSPELIKIAKRTYVAMLTNTGLDLIDPESGKLLLDYEWKYNSYRVLQPQVVDGDSILVPTGSGMGTRRIRIIQTDSGLDTEDVWTSRFLKPDFNDFVIFQDHAYGFDGAIFTCVDLASGERKWKRGRYGKGQVLLLANSGVLLVAGEKGDVILLKVDPTEHRELARFRAIDGKTWNHPVVIGDRLYIRNSREAACYQLPLAEAAGQMP